jgi:coatomer subunit beta'
MDDCKCSSDDMLEHILQDPNSMPRVMTLEYLKRITDNFSDERLLGKGGFANVYKVRLNHNIFPSSHIYVISLIYPEIHIQAC